VIDKRQYYFAAVVVIQIKATWVLKFNCISAVEKDSSSNEKTADSSSLSLMRKYPPGCTFLNGKTALGRDETDARKNADSDTSECSTSRGKLVWKKSDAASKRTTITNWKASRSKSAGRRA